MPASFYFFESLKMYILWFQKNEKNVSNTQTSYIYSASSRVISNYFTPMYDFKGAIIILLLLAQSCIGYFLKI